MQQTKHNLVRNVRPAPMLGWVMLLLAAVALDHWASENAPASPTHSNPHHEAPK